jgi:hypothetical protein
MNKSSEFSSRCVRREMEYWNPELAGRGTVPLDAADDIDERQQSAAACGSNRGGVPRTRREARPHHRGASQPFVWRETVPRPCLCLLVRRALFVEKGIPFPCVLVPHTYSNVGWECQTCPGTSSRAYDDDASPFGEPTRRSSSAFSELGRHSSLLSTTRCSDTLQLAQGARGLTRLIRIFLSRSEDDETDNFAL